MTETDAIVWAGPADLRPLLVPIDSVEPHPRNPRRGQVDVVARSLKDFGQRKPIVVQRSTRYIVAGNHVRRAALEKLGWTHIAASVDDLSDDDATDYLLADNRSSDLGGYDDATLIELLEERADADALTRTGYDADALDDLLAQQNRAGQDEFRQGYQDGGDPEPATRRLAGGDLTEMVLLYGKTDGEQLGRWLKMLQREWRLDGPNAAVYEAVKRCAATL